MAAARSTLKPVGPSPGFTYAHRSILAAWRFLKTQNLGTWFNALANKPSAVYFERINSIPICTVVRLGLRHHIFDIDDFALRIDKSNR